MLEVEKPLVSMNSASAINATVPPPTPLYNATSCGIAVILTSRAGGTPSATPDETGDDQQPVLGIRRIEISVATIATAMPAAAIQLPRTAVSGPVRPIRP